MQVSKLYEDAQYPTRATKGSAGWDLYAQEDVVILPKQSDSIGTGICVDVGRGYVGLLTHRSSFGFKLDTIASFGVVDSDYRGEIRIKLFNLGNEGIYIKKGDRVAQLVVVPVFFSAYKEVDKLGETTRGSGGMGSTGGVSTGANVISNTIR